MFSYLRGLRAVRSLSLFALLASYAIGAMGQSHGPLQVTPEVHHDTLSSLRDVVPQEHPDTDREEHDIPLPYFPPNQTDGAVQRTASPAKFTPSIISDVDGVGNGFSGPQGAYTVSSIPPDINGAVGATQYVQVVNSSLAVFNKTTKAVVHGPVATASLWSGFGGICQTDNDGDAVVVYDKAANRWVISQFAVTGAGTASVPYLQCVAVSQTSDATGGYNRYSFSYGTVFPDYPKMGVWPDAYYETFNMFNGNTFAGAKLCAYDRTSMLTGAAASQQCFQLSTSFGGVLPSDLDGSTAPPANSPNYMINFGTNKLNLWKFHVDWATTANTTLTGPIAITVAAFTPACSGGGTCIPQSTTTRTLDSLADRMMFRLAYRNFGANESLVVNNSVTVGGSVGIRWYEIRSPGTTPAVFQQSTFAPDTTYRWMGSVAMDQQGNMALGYSASSSSMLPAINYTGRLVNDTLSTMEAENSLIAGAGAQNGTYSRWGDYSAMTIDPADDCTFWYTNEYYKVSHAFNWSTRIGSFKFPTCGVTYTLTYTAGTNGTITGTTPQTVNSGASGTAVTAVPNAGYHFVQWSDNVLTATRTDTNVTANISVTASFAINTYTLTYTAGTNGTITGTTPQTVNSGASGTAVTAVPNAGYHFVQWSDNVLTATRTDTNVTANISVTASFAINTYTLTYTAGTNGTITGTTPQTVNSGASGTAVTAVPNAGYHFVQWSDNVLTATRTDTNVTANISVTASFAINTYTLTYTAGTNGTITGTTPQTVNSGASGTAVTAVPNAGYHFVQWSDNVLTATRTDTNVTANISVTASFAINTYTLTYTAGTNGTITGTTPQTVNSGASGTAVTAVPNAGYHFVQWSDNVLTATRTDTNVTANISVTASFAINTYTLTYTAGTNGTITGTTPQTVNSGASGTAVTAVPNAGYHFVQWSDNVLTATRTDTNVTANISVTASFAINTYTLTYTAGTNGTITGTTPQTVNSGASGTAVTAVPNAGYHFVQWSDNVLTATRTDTNVTANISVTASFAINTYTLTYTAGTNGTITGTTPQTVNSGASGTAVTAVPNAGYHFVQWSDNVLTATRTDTNVTANISVTASFAINTYTLTYTAGTNGTITGTTPQTVNSGASGTAVTAVPNAGYHFVQWSDNVLTATRTDTNVTANISVTASFAANVLVFTPQPPNVARGQALGTVVVTEQDGSGNTIIDNGSSVDFTIAACAGSFDLGSVTMINGVATLVISQRFYTLATGLQISASTATLSSMSQPFNVQASADYVFADGYEGCRL